VRMGRTLVHAPSAFKNDVASSSPDELAQLCDDAYGLLTGGKTHQEVVRSMVSVGWSPGFAKWVTNQVQLRGSDIRIDVPRPSTSWRIPPELRKEYAFYAFVLLIAGLATFGLAFAQRSEPGTHIWISAPGLFTVGGIFLKRAIKGKW